MTPSPASARAAAYLAALGVPEPPRRALAGEVAASAGEGAGAIGRALDGLRARLAGEGADGGFRAWRLRAFGAQPGANAGLPAVPPLQRAPMPPALVGAGRRRVRPVAAKLRHRSRRAIARRALLGLLVLAPSVVAGGFMLNVLPYRGRTLLEAAIAMVFAALFGWISIGFWTALFGFLTLLSGRRSSVSHLPAQAAGAELDPELRVAVLMPICDEPVDRVFAGLRATRASLARTGALERFDFFVLSDSRDPDTWVDEEEAWAEWCREVGGFGRIFYRRRRAPVKRKSGNVADFCRRWGRRYRYMVLLDADSVMAGETLVHLVRLMEARPDVGIVQTRPAAVRRRSLFARAQQLANNLYGPLFAAGLHFWQLGEGSYWGHNAIVRVAPFMEHCGLPRLPGRPPLGGEILSHDFVEAALMGRAGWSVFLAWDLPGSWEELPSSLLEELGRDRRWCQGNLQHLSLVATPGLRSAHRALFLNGALSYGAALLWLAFLVLSSARAVLGYFQPPDYFPPGPSLFPDWPVWRPDWAMALGAVTLAILFLPKVLAVSWAALRPGGAAAWGGAGRLLLGVALEIALSSLFAPIRAVFHAKFVVWNLLGQSVSWGGRERGDRGTPWGEALRQHGLDTLVASAWALGVFALSPGFFWWLAPITGALVLSVPLSVWTSRASLGDAARRRGLLLTPEELDAPAELRDLECALDAARAARERRAPERRRGLLRAAADPSANAIHRALLRGARRRSARGCEIRRKRLDRALAAGPAALDRSERLALLVDPEAVDALHREAWALEDPEAARAWGIADL